MDTLQNNTDTLKCGCSIAIVLLESKAIDDDEEEWTNCFINDFNE